MNDSVSEKKNIPPTSTTENSDLHFLDYWRVVRARKEIILAVTLLVSITGIIVTLGVLPRIYKASSIIRVHQDEHDVEVFGRSSGNSYNPYFLLTEYEVIKSLPILTKVVQRLELHKIWGEKHTKDQTPLSLHEAVNFLEASLSVQQYRNTSLIEISISSEDKEEAKRIANEIPQVYFEHRISLQREELQRGLEALRFEFEKQGEKVDEAYTDQERIRKELDISLITSGISLDKIKLQSLEMQRIELGQEVQAKKAMMEQLLPLQGTEFIDAINLLFADKTLDKIRNLLLDAEVMLITQLQTLGDNHPDVLQLKAGAAELQENLDVAIRGAKNGIKGSYEVSKARYDKLVQELEMVRKSDIIEEGEKYLPFNKARRNVNMQRGLYDAINARIAQEGVELGVPITPMEIVEPAILPRTFNSPNIPLNIALSSIVGLLLGFGLAFFLEYLDTSVKTVDDIERYLGLPVIGVIPQKVKPLNQEGPDSPHAEAYRVLRTNLQFSVQEHRGGAFACVSGGVGEGKSTTLFNLAYICAYMGDRVLIVDSDLRRPVQHNFLKMSNHFGLTNVLLRDVPIEETIKTTNVPNLHFLPSGKLPRTSIGLLDNQRVRELIKNLKARYDYVFCDSPPVMGVSDASILASELDGVLLVVQYRKYPRVMPARAKRLIENVGGNIVGVVMNNINILRDDYYYYYNSYYSHYSATDQSDASQEQSIKRKEQT